MLSIEYSLGLRIAPNVTLKGAEAKGVYGGWDMNYEVRGGDLIFSPNDSSEVTDVHPLYLEAISESDASGW